MVSAALGLLAAATLSWPARNAARRMTRLFPRGSTTGRRRPAPGFGVAVAVLGLLALSWCGPGVAVAAVLVTVTARWRWRARRTRQRALTGAAGMAQALRGLVAELRAGAHPAVAAENVAAESDGQAAAVLTAIATTSRLGGDVGRTLAGHAEQSPAMRPVLAQLSSAWSLVARYGLPLAEVLEATRADLDHRVSFGKQVAARMAGPRSAAAVLAALPAAGVLIGEAMGVHPLRVLAFTPAGHVLMVLGTALACAGVAWSARLTDRAAVLR